MRNPEMITKGNKMLLFFLKIPSNDFLGIEWRSVWRIFFFFLTRRKKKVESKLEGQLCCMMPSCIAFYPGILTKT